LRKESGSLAFRTLKITKINPNTKIKSNLENQRINKTGIITTKTIAIVKYIQTNLTKLRKKKDKN